MYVYIYYLNTYLIINIAYLKVTCRLSFFLAPDCLCLFTGIVIQQLWSSAFSGKHEVWAGSGRGRRNGAPSPPPPPPANSILCILVSFISHKPDRKGTLASDLKWAGAWDQPPPPLVHATVIGFKWFVKRNMKSRSESNDLWYALWSPVMNQMICDMRFEVPLRNQMIRDTRFEVPLWIKWFAICALKVNKSND